MSQKRLHMISLPKDRNIDNSVQYGTIHASYALLHHALGEPNLPPAGIQYRWIRDIDGEQVIVTSTAVLDEWTVSGNSEKCMQLLTESLAERTDARF